MANFRVSLVLLLLVAVAACNRNISIEAVDTAAEVVAIAQLQSDWSDMFAARDLDGVAALFAPKTVLIMPGSEPIVGAESVRRATEEMLNSDNVVSWASDYAFVSPSGGMAYDYGTATTNLANGTIVKGQYLVVWVKENNQWKVAADMFN